MKRLSSKGRGKCGTRKGLSHRKQVNGSAKAYRSLGCFDTNGVFLFFFIPRELVHVPNSSRTGV